jgi:hypothetical protein
MRATSAAAISILAVCTMSASARAQEEEEVDCAPVDAPIETEFFQDGCVSLFGLCTRGNITSGLLEGSTSFVVVELDLATGLYGGDLLITTRRGDLTIHDSGVLNPDATFFEKDEIVSGTRKFARATGPFFSSGTMTFNVDGSPKGFQGNVFGRICGLPDDLDERE